MPKPEQFDVLQALSLARTALDDPGALTEQELARVVTHFTAPRSPWSHGLSVYAIDRIDETIGALYYEPANDARAEAVWVLTHLGRLLANVTDGLDDQEFPSARFASAAHALEQAGDLIDGAILVLEGKDEEDV
jgi:hypothetical protein